MSFQLTKIVVPVDFSEGSQAALDCAIALAAKTSARVEVLHVWEEAVYHGTDHVVVRDETGAHHTLHDVVRGQAERELAAFLEGNAKRGHTVEGRMVTGDPVTEILVAAKGCDLVVIGTHGRGALARWFLGSVADRVVRSSDTPVLTVRAKAKDVHA